MTEFTKTACIFGGSGFIGTQIVRELARQGYRIKVASRVPERAYDLRPCGSVGQIVPFACDYKEDDSLKNSVRGCDLVVNTIGILFEKGKRATFENIHTKLPARIAQACSDEKVSRFVHISALGVDTGSSNYAKSKLAGEEALLKIFPKATILRPSVVFGPGDNFFNMFAKLSVVAPALPLIGGGKTKFQPVYVGDVADSVVAAATNAAIGDNSPQGKIYELGGPDVLSFKEIYEELFRQTGRRRALVNLPWGIASAQGAVMNALMPTPLLTADQVESLKTDNVVGQNALTLQDLGVMPTSMSTILPTYLARFKPGGRFHGKTNAQKSA